MLSHLADFLRDPKAHKRGRRHSPHLHQCKSVTLTSCLCPERGFRSAGRAPGTAAVPLGPRRVTSSLSWPYVRVLTGIRTPLTAHHFNLNTIFSTACTNISLLKLWLNAEPRCALITRHFHAMQLMLTFGRRCWSEG